MKASHPDESLEPARARQGSSLTINAIVNAAGSIAYYVAVVLVTPLAIASLGDREWGLWQIVGSITSYGLLIELGLTSAVSYQVSGSVARDDLDTLSKSLSNARLYMLAAAFALVLITLAGGPPLLGSLVDEGEVSIATSALFLSVGIAAVSLPVRIYLSVLSGLQQYQRMAVFRLLGGFFLVGMVAGMWFFTRIEFIQFVIIMSIVPAIAPVCSWLACRRLLPRSALRWRPIDWPHFRSMLAYAASTIVYSTGSVLLFQSMKLMASWRAGGPEAAGHIGIVINIVQILAVVFIPIAAVVHPRASELVGRGREDEIPGVLLRALKTMSLLAVPAIVFLVLEPRLIFEAWLGGAVSESTLDSLARTVRWMAIGQGLYVLFLPCFYALLGLGEHRVFGLGMIAAGLINIALGWIMTGYDPRIETLGVAFGIALGGLVLFLTLPVTLRRFGLGVGPVFAHTLALPLAASLPGAIGLSYLPPFQIPLVDLGLSAILFSVMTLPGILWIRARNS